MTFDLRGKPPARFPVDLRVGQVLFKMFLKHRMRAFQGAFHANPDYALWYGWSEMVRDLADIKKMAEEMRIHHKG